MKKPSSATFLGYLDFTLNGLLHSFIDKFYSKHKELFAKEEFFDDWKYFLTAACCGIFLKMKERSKSEHEKLYEQLEKDRPELWPAVKDFSDFVDKIDKNVSDDIYNGSIGYWVLLNVKGEKPTDREVQEVSAVIARLLFSQIDDYRRLNK
jgi:hypothetical protein